MGFARVSKVSVSGLIREFWEFQIRANRENELRNYILPINPNRKAFGSLVLGAWRSRSRYIAGTSISSAERRRRYRLIKARIYAIETATIDEPAAYVSCVKHMSRYTRSVVWRQLDSVNRAGQLVVDFRGSLVDSELSEEERENRFFAYRERLNQIRDATSYVSPSTRTVYTAEENREIAAAKSRGDYVVGVLEESDDETSDGHSSVVSNWEDAAE